MRVVWLSKEDFTLFHQDITALEFEFFATHAGAFKRMWREQSRKFWSVFINTFDHFIWNYGVMKDFAMTEHKSRGYVDEIVGYIRRQFVDGSVATAKSLVLDCAVVAQNRHCIIVLDKANYTQSPFVVKETREVFRQLFGSPSDKRTFMKMICGLPVYIKFAGAIVSCLRRWLVADDIPSDEKMEAEYLASIHKGGLNERGIVEYKEDLLRVVGRLKPPTTVDEPKVPTIRPKMSVESENVTSEEGEKCEGVKKKRKRKKKKSPMAAAATTTTEGEGERGGERERDVETKAEVVESERERALTPAVDGAEVREREKNTSNSPNSVADSGIGSGAEPVAMDTPAHLTTESGRNDGVLSEKVDLRRRKLHMCACCGLGEIVAKTFKRCQRCRGLPNPNYYCSRECQAKHWKEHKLDHREEEGEKD